MIGCFLCRLMIFDNTFFIRKILASVLQGLCLTPGRRLQATIEKLNMCTPFSNPPDVVLKALLELVQRQKWSNSLEDLAVSIEALKDEEQDFKTNTNLVLMAILDRLANSGEWKLMEMAHRHELKYIVDTSLSCCHRYTDSKWKPRSDAKEWTLPFVCSSTSPNNQITVEGLQELISRFNRETTDVECKRCSEQVKLTLFFYIPHACDPDFLTLVCNEPISLQDRNVKLVFSNSMYSVKAVTHWQEERKVAAVSREKNDGSWWWHGIDKSQASEYQYTQNQLQTFVHFKDVVVLFAVRIGSADEEIEEQAENDNNAGIVENIDICDTAMDCEKSQNYNDKDLIEEDNRNREQSRYHDSGNQNLLYDFEAAVIESRRTNPNLKTQAEMVDGGIRCMGSFGVVCLRPEPGDYTNMDGDCLWTCFVKSRKPSLVGVALRAEAFHFRLKCVGAAIEEIKKMDAERLAMVQSVIADAKEGVPPQSREEIIGHLERYMESGSWDGRMGDILPYVAAAFLNQGLLIINLDVNTISYAAPECKMFHGREDFKVPCIAARQVNHFEAVPVMPDSCEAATGLYELLKNGQHLTIQADVGDINDGEFEPEQTSTPLTEETRAENDRSEFEAETTKVRSNQTQLEKENKYPTNLLIIFSMIQRNMQVDDVNLSSTRVSSQLDPSQRSSQIFAETHVCLCNYDGLLADHLRNSKQCLDNLRKYPQLRMAAPNDEVFIVKSVIILRGCPAPGCPGGTHLQIPESCLVWWQQVGWKVMRWKGSSENAEAGEIKKRESMFRRNFVRRNTQPDGSSNSKDIDYNQSSQQVENANLDIQREVEGCCQFCQNKEAIISHLHQSKPCLRAYVKQYLPKRGQSYLGKRDLAVFDLSLMISECANSACVGCLQQEGLRRHMQGDCFQFYQNEGEKLFQWDSGSDETSVYEKLKKRKTWLKNLLKDGGIYEEDIAKVMRMECRRCKIRGPLLDDSDHKMCAVDIDQTSGGLVWECSKCEKGDKMHGEMVLQAIEKAAELGAPIESDDSMKMVVVEDKQHDCQRVVFVPACLLTDYDVPNINDRELNPLHTTVLVPKNPEALDQIGDEASERANLTKESLEKVAEFFGKRFFVGPVTECISVLYRLKIAQIRVERLSMLSLLKKTTKGKVKSRNPNQVSCKERKPHFATTQKFCLTSTCSWSSSAKEKRSRESAARACVNGRVKIKVDMKIIQELAKDSPHLKDIIYETLLLHNPPLISVAPLVLSYLKAKVSLLVKHLFSQTFKDWDLDLRFAEKEWTVRLVGFVYCEEFEELNSNIASGVVSQEEIIREVLKHRRLLPTTTTSRREIMEVHSMTEEQAEVRFYLTLNHICF